MFTEPASCVGCDVHVHVHSIIVTVRTRMYSTGESGVGKSCLVLRFVKGEYSDHLEATIGGIYFIEHCMHMWAITILIPIHAPLSFLSPFSPAAFLTQTVNLDDTTVKFEIWDTAGQERYHSLAPMYYRGAQAAIVVYDITNMVGVAQYECAYVSVLGHVITYMLVWLLQMK